MDCRSGRVREHEAVAAGGNGDLQFAVRLGHKLTVDLLDDVARVESLLSPERSIVPVVPSCRV